MPEDVLCFQQPNDVRDSVLNTTIDIRKFLGTYVLLRLSKSPGRYSTKHAQE